MVITILYISVPTIFYVLSLYLSNKRNSNSVESNFNMCSVSLYPYGDYSQAVKEDMIKYLKELMGKLKYVNKNLDTDRILQDWFMKYNYPVLSREDLYTSYQSTLDIIKGVIYPIETQYNTVSEVMDEMQNKIPRSIRRNDYIQIYELINLIKSIKTY